MTRLPSVKTLSQVFNDPKRARAILEMKRRQLEAETVVQDYVRQCYHPPRTCDMRMHLLDSLESGLHGVEGFQVGEQSADYLNAGETYAATLIRFEGRYRVQSVGDFIEIQERRGYKCH